MSNAPKVKIVYLYDDGDEMCVLLDEGQGHGAFKDLIERFNTQDQAMCNEENPNGPAHEQWLGFSDFAEENGFTLVEADFYSP